jgi:hypothetical protein
MLAWWVVLMLLVALAMWVVRMTSNDQAQAEDAQNVETTLSQSLPEQAKPSSPSKAMPLPIKQGQPDHYICFYDGMVDYGEYPVIAARLRADGRTLPGMGSSDGTECYDAEPWLRLMSDARSIARHKAEKRLNKALDGQSSWIDKLNAVTQWACEGNTVKSQEWDVANEAYDKHWRVSIEFDVPDNLSAAIERFCPTIDYYDSIDTGGSGF